MITDLSISRRHVEERIKRDVQPMAEAKQGQVPAPRKRQLGWRTPWIKILRAADARGQLGDNRAP
jgi:hypothetical protein